MSEQYKPSFVRLIATAFASHPRLGGVLFGAAIGLMLLVGCSSGVHPSSARSAQASAEVDVPRGAKAYSTEARPDGRRGGGADSEAEELLEKLLGARGEKAEPDGALADVAAWLLQRVYRNEDVSNVRIAIDAAQRFGFVGEINGVMTGSLASDDGKRGLELVVSQVPHGDITNRYGIVAGKGRDVAIVLGAVELTLDDFPRELAPGSTLQVKGELSRRYQRASVFSTSPDGKVREQPMAARAIDTSVIFRDTGVHKLEIMGYGETGPRVLVNVPIYVGVSGSRDTGTAGNVDPDLTTDRAEAILLELLNQERAKHGIAKAVPDEELRAVAVAHSRDMAEHHFASHISPTTGSPDDRKAKAGLRVTQVSECIAGDVTPEGAHRGLLDSPSHRAGMLDPKFGHVGIGVAFEDVGGGHRRIMVTLLFARRPPPGDARLGPSELLEIIGAQRKAKKLPALRVDPVLTAAAQTAHKALTSGSVKNGDQVVAVVNRELNASVDRTGVGRVSCSSYFEINDRYQIEDDEFLNRADMRSIGIETAPITKNGERELAVIMIVDNGPGKVTNCR
jgi:uncharacterized protein YkwD